MRVRNLLSEMSKYLRRIWADDVNNCSLSRSWLDYCFSSQTVHNYIADVSIDYNYRGSDHFPILVNLRIPSIQSVEIVQCDSYCVKFFNALLRILSSFIFSYSVDIQFSKLTLIHFYFVCIKAIKLSIITYIKCPSRMGKVFGAHASSHQNILRN